MISPQDGCEMLNRPSEVLVFFILVEREKTLLGLRLRCLLILLDIFLLLALSFLIVGGGLALSRFLEHDPAVGRRNTLCKEMNKLEHCCCVSIQSDRQSKLLRDSPMEIGNENRDIG